MAFQLSDELLGSLVPIVLYWIYSGVYMLLLRFEKYRLHSKQEDNLKNLVSKREVVKGVLFQQAIQVTFALLAFMIAGKGKDASHVSQPSLLVQVRQFFIAMVIMDAWQYFMHRYMHHNKFMYRHFHSWHHRLVAPYAFGAQYNHPVDGLLTETLSAALGYLISGMTPRTSIYFFSFATIKGIDDHCGFLLPGNVFHLLFKNNTAYHDIHHQLSGTKYNFSQPFFITWDKIFKTYMPYTIEKREDGGFEARPAKD